MLLRERERLRNQELDLKLKSVNLDLKLLNSLNKNKQGLLVKEKQTVTHNIADLTKQLKQRNNKIAQNRQSKIKTADWLAQKGINLRQAYDQMKKNQIIVIDLPPQLKDKSKKQEKDSSQTQLGFTTNNQIDYIRSYKQLVVYSLMKITMNNSKEYKSNAVLARMKIIDRLKGKRQKNDQQKNKAIQMNPIIQQQSYSDIVKQFVRQNNFSIKTICNSFQKKFQNKKQFWSIVKEHVDFLNKEKYNGQEYLQEQQDERNLYLNSQVMLISLQMVERIFDEKLPSNRKQIQILFKKLYGSSSRRINVHYNQRGVPNWGIGYLLYRAGRVKDFYQECLSESKMLKLRQQFAAYDESVFNRNPSFSTVGFFSQVSDDFYDQLQYILRGQSRFVSSIVLDYDSLQTVWVILRTMGIYRNMSYSNQNDYQQILNSLFLKYEKSPMTKQELHNALYLGAYRNILQFFTNNNNKSYDPYNNNEVFTHNDCFHLLLTVYKNSRLWSNCDMINNKKKQKMFSMQQKINENYFQNQELRDLFQENLIDYLYYLKNIQNGDQYYVSYFMLLQPESMIRYSKTLIKTKEDFNNFRWKQFFQILEQRNGPAQARQFFDRFVSQILKNFRPETYGDYKFIAEKFRTLVDDQQTQVEYLIQLLAKNEYYSHGDRFDDFISMNRFSKPVNSIQDQSYLNFLGFNEQLSYQGTRNSQQNLTPEKMPTQINKIFTFLQKYYKLQQKSLTSYSSSSSYKQNEKSSKQKILKNVLIFLNEFRQTTKLIQNKDSQKLMKQQIKFELYTTEAKSDLKDVLLYLRNKDIFNLYIYYLKERIRAAEIMYEQQCKMTTNASQNILKMIQKLENSSIWKQDDYFNCKNTKQNQIKMSLAASQLKNYLTLRIEDAPRY